MELDGQWAYNRAVERYNEAEFALEQAQEGVDYAWARLQEANKEVS